ncbi:MAG TPA: formimidoylglutamate deiminase [Alphaproteobacteria bacterium]|nr:formimidoylglutamate deiminase [Alphaproteobacteria bacterium]
MKEIVTVAATKILHAKSALLPVGWAQNLRIEVDGGGTIAAVGPVRAGESSAHETFGLVLPGIPNLHCHAFQRAMAGLAERAGPTGDDFWSWREVMYRFLDRLTPEEIEAIAAQLYLEMLKAGYTSVAEFHYLHNDPTGAAFANPAELSERVAAGAGRAGIRLTLLPVLYQTGNFGGLPPNPGQRRFVKETDAFADLLERVAKLAHDTRAFRLGLAPHSLRAVPPESLHAAVSIIDRIDPTAPIHIHAAEQEKEVRDCIAWSGTRPVRWLLDNAHIDGRWVLVHATHIEHDERQRLARSGAVAGLCPTTEGNLGDGLFPLRDYLSEEGRFGIGTDSNIVVDPAEELRWLHYGQRLSRERRSLEIDPPGTSLGTRLWHHSIAGGAQALGQAIGGLAVGNQADLLVIDEEHPALVGRVGDLALDSLVFSSARGAVRHVMVGGHWVVRDHHHGDEDRITNAYRRVAQSLARA